MLAAAKNYDVICFQMRNYITHLESPMKKEYNRLLDEIRSILVSKNLNPKQGLDSILPLVFNFRVKAIKWFWEEGELDFNELMDEAYPLLEELKQNSKLEILAENILFAIRCNKRVVDALIQSGELSAEKISSSADQLPVITYDQFLSSLAFNMPNDEIAQKVLDWTNSSLYIEVITVSAALVNDEEIKVSDKIINQLAFLIADAAQEYSAIATEFGILKQRSSKQSFEISTIDKTFSKEQKRLADLGITDFADNF